jgi:hypothetical protein
MGSVLNHPAFAAATWIVIAPRRIQAGARNQSKSQLSPASSRPQASGPKPAASTPSSGRPTTYR